jgi:hypothetical protein
MQKPDLLRPTLVSGLIFGFLSGLPVLNMGNCCCCLWLWATGWLAAFLYAREARRMGYPFGAAGGALVGLVAGLFGGFVCSILETLINVVFGGRMREMTLSILDQMEFPPDFEPMMEMIRQGMEQEQTVIGLLLTLLGNLFFFGLFSTIGGLLTAVFLDRGGRSPVAPPSGPAPGGWTPPTAPPRGGPTPPAPPAQGGPPASGSTSGGWTPPSESPPRQGGTPQGSGSGGPAQGPGAGGPGQSPGTGGPAPGGWKPPESGEGR